MHQKQNTIRQLIKKEWDIQRILVMEFFVGLTLVLLLWQVFRTYYRPIEFFKVLTWCVNPPFAFCFSIIFVLTGSFLIIIFSVFTSIAESYLSPMKPILFVRSIMFMVNCIPIYIFTDFWRFVYGYEKTPVFSQLFFYGIAALIFGNAIWLYIHRYFVEIIKQEMKQPYFETANALGISFFWVICPRIRLLILDVIRSIMLVLMGSAIFIEKRFHYPVGDHYAFEGLGYLFEYDLIQMKVNHDYEMILGIILLILFFSSFIQFFVNQLRYYYQPEVCFGK